MRFHSRIGIRALLRTLLFFGWGIFVIWLKMSGRIRNYIAPRNDVYVLCFGLFMLFLGLFSLREIRSFRRQGGMMGLIFCFLVPLLLMIGVRPIALTRTELASATESLTEKAGSPPVAAPSETDDAVSDRPGEFELTEDFLPLERTGSQAVDGKFTMTDENYFRCIEELYADPAKYEGYAIEQTGFVIRQGEMDPDELVTARLLMTCCAQDTVLIGFLCQYEGDLPEEEEWLTLEGVLTTKEKGGKLIPYVRITAFRRIEKPNGPAYVYPF